MNTGPRILLIDDEPQILEVLGAGLDSLGYQVETANGGKAGLEKFAKGNFDVVLCDLVMPEVNGTQVLEKIQSLDQNVPVLMITGFPTVDTAVQAMAQGAYDYVTKPFNLDNLDLRIKRSLELRLSNDRARSSKSLILLLMLSIPFWVILGLTLALIFHKH